MAGLFSSIPLWSKLIPAAHSGYGFPPLGSADGAARVGTVVLALATTYFAFFSRAPLPNRTGKRIPAAIVFAFICLCVYIGLFLRFVRTIDIPSKNISVQVSVGYERTEFAKINFNADTDWELLRDRGTGEEEIWRLWTARSLLTSRLSLYTTYSLFIFSLVAAFSWGVLYQENERRP
jgi:hypothetical protein